MAILNVGSINWDHTYRVTHFPAPGETISAKSAAKGLGGKGLNQSVAVLRSGGDVLHFGAVGSDDQDIGPALEGLGLDLSALQRAKSVQTGSAFILVDDSGENQIVIDAGANGALSPEAISQAIDRMATGDWLLVQNETNAVSNAVDFAKDRGLKVALVAAPFDADAVVPLIGRIDLLSVNEIEFKQVCAAIGGEENLPAGLDLFVSLGAKGAFFRRAGKETRISALSVEVVDTTGAGDTAFGAFLARLDLGDSIETALGFAMAAAAVQVTRQGAVTAIPDQAEVRAFMLEIE